MSEPSNKKSSASSANKRKVTTTESSNKEAKLVATAVVEEPVVVVIDTKNVPSADAQVVMISTLNNIHSECQDYILEVKLIDKGDLRNVNTMNGPKKVFNAMFEDACNDTIILSGWGESDILDDPCAQFHEFLETGQCYQMSNFALKASSSFNRQSCPCKFILNLKFPDEKGIGGLYITTVDSIVTESVAERVEQKQKFETISTLPQIFLESDEKDRFSGNGVLIFNPNIHVAGLIIHFEPAKSFLSRRGKECVMSKLVLADESDSCVSITMWGDKSSIVYKVGHIALYRNAAISYNITGKHFELCNGNIEIIQDVTTPHNNQHIAKLQRWSRTAELDMAKYINISQYNANKTAARNNFNSLDNAPITNRVTCAQLLKWREEARNLIKEAESEKLILPNEYNAEKALPAATFAKIAKGTFSVLGQVETVTFSDAKQAETQKTNALKANTQSLIYPCCPNPVHGRYKYKVDFKPQQPNVCHCKDKACSSQSYETWIYGVSAVLKICDFTATLDATTFSLEGLVPSEMASADKLLLECKNLKFANPGEILYDSVRELSSVDHLVLNDLVVQSIDDYVSKAGKMFVFVITVHPDLKEGLAIRISDIRNPNYEQENNLLTKQLESNVH